MRNPSNVNMISKTNRVSDGCDPKTQDACRENYISASINGLHGKSNDAVTVCQELMKRLEPVMRNEPSAVHGDPHQVGSESCSVAIADSINTATEKVSRVLEMMKDMLHRLEL